MLDGAVVDLLVEDRPGPGHSSSSSSSSSGADGGGGPAVAGVVLVSGERIRCRAVVITTGTFLRGVIHVGSQSRPAGRIASLISAQAAAKPEAAAAAVRAAEMTDQADEVAAGGKPERSTGVFGCGAACVRHAVEGASSARGLAARYGHTFAAVLPLPSLHCRSRHAAGAAVCRAGVCAGAPQDWHAAAPGR